MDERAIRKELEVDLRAATTTGELLYLEGHTDVTMLQGLLGHEPEESVPTAGLPIDGVWVRGLSARSGSGSRAVELRVEVAGKYDYRGVHGIVDGDGREYATLAASFDPPFAEPLQTWKAYCLENLLAQSAWPAGWGTMPDWNAILGSYVPYAALNRVVAIVQGRWRSLGVARFTDPIVHQPTRTTTNVRDQLERDETTLQGLGELVTVFDVEVRRCEEALATSLAHAHALINGKWLVEVYASGVSNRSPEQCRLEWARHVGRNGGHPEVIAWWRRLVAT